ncbi:MAG: class I SAM-dependent methyltransferase [bacterium]|nr:MAG: class I SAM-dependent methyltransferase [bacterium]
MKKLETHFSKIAGYYANLRTTDIEPIMFIKNKLNNSVKINAADIGCGAGRYDLKLCQHLHNEIQIICIDNSKEMLKQISRKLRKSQKKKFGLVNALSEHLPIANDSLDCLLSFNALHHFKLSIFLNEASRILKKNGTLFIYTRLRSQNKKNIWGKFFPKFYEKETRLYELEQLRKFIDDNRFLELDAVKFFKYERIASLEWLETQAQHHHYSTFCFYDKREFEAALLQFRSNLANHFNDLNDIKWYDENVMLIIHKKQ